MSGSQRMMVAALLLAACGAQAAEGKRLFRAGAAAVDVSPQYFPVIVNGGFTEGKATKLTDPLHARALVLDDGTTQIALGVVDNCVVPQAIFDAAKAAASKATGIPPDRMLLSATHCHSAPSVCGALGSGVEQPYAKWLPGRIAEAIVRAHAALAPARVGWAVGQDPTNVFCRRFLMKPGTAPNCPFTGHEANQAQMNPGHQNPNAVRRTGPADPAVSVLSVQTPDGRPVAFLGNYSTHYAGAPPISADYFGVFCERMKTLLGADTANPAFVGLMTNGTSGDANCLDFVNPPRKYDRFTVGEDVAKAAFEAAKTIRYHDWVPLVMAETRLPLAIRMPGADEVAKAKEFLAPFAGRKPQTQVEVYAHETVFLSQLPPVREVKLQAIRIGELGIVAIPCEVYGSTGLRIKKDSPLKPTFTIELANGYDGYLPPPEQHELGGYTTWRARSSCLEVQAEPKIVAALLDLLARVARERSEEK